MVGWFYISINITPFLAVMAPSPGQDFDSLREDGSWGTWTDRPLVDFGDLVVPSEVNEKIRRQWGDANKHSSIVDPLVLCLKKKHLSIDILQKKPVIVVINDHISSYLGCPTFFEGGAPNPKAQE